MARRLWQLLEPLHAVVYFAPEVHERYRRAGLKGFWMGYFAGRAWPLGPVPAEVVTATFFGFHPAMVRRAIPDAWSFAAIDDIAGARAAGVDEALRRLLGGAATSAAVAEAADLASDAARAGSLAGRPLYAAHRSLPFPDAAHLRLWHAATLLREHRGDGHVAANVAEGLDGLAAHVLFAATGAVPRPTLQDNRGWSDGEWDAAVAALRDRGLLDETGRLTPAGAALRSAIEERTDAAALPPYASLGSAGVARLDALLQPLAHAVVDAGGIPVPNPMGVPWPPSEHPVTA